MTKLTVLTFPDERLRIKAKPVAVVNGEIKRLVKSMFKTMYDAKGIGLAATQVNYHQRVIVIDVSADASQPLVFINPVIKESSGSIEHEEGCLSVPSFTALIKRAESIVVEALNIKGETFSQQADGLLAVCLQHEMDHLQGKLFVDYLSKLKQQRLLNFLRKQAS